MNERFTVNRRSFLGIGRELKSQYGAGRKLVMDYYEPRIPLGGGALYGKELSHIDRLGAFQARCMAEDMVNKGATDALIRICFGPGMNEPLIVDIQSDRRPPDVPYEYFSFNSMQQRICIT